MDTFSVCVTIVSVILGIAYPIITQITSNDKYSSEAILNLFNSMQEKKIFLPNLILALISIGVYLIAGNPLFKFNCFFLDWLVINSASIVVFIATTTLVINFIRLVMKVEIFYRTSALINYLAKFKYEVIDHNKFETFDCLSDLLYWSVQNQDSNANKQLLGYFNEIFHLYREKYKEEYALVYPDSFYSMLYNLVKKIVNTDKNSLHVIEHKAITGVWILGSNFNANKISEESYIWLWRNLALAISNDKDDLVFQFWENSHQFYKFNFDYIQPEYDYINEEYVVINQNTIDERNKLRSHFFEFHIALGGLLVFKQKFELLKRIFNYTTSIPPDYVLLPKQMIEIYQSFFDFFDPFDRKNSWISHKYYFPGLKGLNADREIKEWICKYIGLLFIRQLNVKSHYVNYNPHELYNLPSELSEKRFWSENVRYFKSFINELLEEKIDLLSFLNFNNDINYIEKAADYEKQVVNDFIKSKEEELPKEEKVNLFLNTSNNILENTFSKYKDLRNLGVLSPKDETNLFYIKGHGIVTIKDAFLDVGVDHMNFHSFLAESVSKKVSEGYFQIFNSNVTTTFVFEQQNVFEAILKMKLNAEEHLIIVFGFVNIEYYIDILKVENLSKHKFNEVEIRYYSGTAYGLTNSIFILNKNELPYIEYVELDKEIVDLYDLKRINEDYNIYATVSDLSSNVTLRNELEKENKFNEKELLESVWQAISFKTIFKWKKEVKMYRIYVKNAYDDNRKLSDINDVLTF